MCVCVCDVQHIVTLNLVLTDVVGREAECVCTCDVQHIVTLNLVLTDVVGGEG